MRPISLTMTAFGPFPGTEQVDFEKFGDAPLFLINGPTGSGKTTILDAMCFALYGQTTGDEREGNQMRCDLAPAETLAEVALTFELGGQRYRIRRVPEQPKPKLRGEGTTSHSTEAQLWSLDQDGEEQLIVARKVKDATAEIENRTGLNADQFRQVMVLPQGKFRQLLMADSKDREQIFGQLFQTQVYKKLEDNLKAQSAEIRREVQKFEHVQEGILEAAELDSPQALIEELTLLKPECEEALRLKDIKNKELTVSSNKLLKANALLVSFENLAKAEAQQQQLADKKNAVDVQRDQLKQAEQAQKIKPEFDQVERNQQALSDAKGKLHKAAQQQGDCKTAFEESDKTNQTAEQKRGQLDTAKQQLTKLESYHERSDQLAQALTVLRNAKSEEGTAKNNVIQAELSLKTSINDREKSLGQQQSIQRELGSLSDKQLQIKGLADQLVDKVVLQGLQNKVDQADKKLKQAKEQGINLKTEFETFETKTKTLELAWHQGQAAILAQELNTGQPCPVCGSNEHPQPAHSEQALPTELELEQARTDQQQASNKLIAARENYAGLKSSLDALQKQCDEALAKLGGAANLPLDQLQQQHDTVKQDVAKLLKQQLLLTELEKSINALKSSEEQARTALDAATKHLSEITIQLATANSGVSAAEQELPEEYRQTGTLQAAITQARNTIDEIEQELKKARKDYENANAAWQAAKATEHAAIETQEGAETFLKQANNTWSTALQASCFETQQDYLSAGLSEADFKTLQQGIADYVGECQRVSGSLEQQQKALEGQQKPDLNIFEAAQEVAEQEKREAEDRWFVLDKRLTAIQNTQTKLDKAKADCKALEDEYKVIGTLSDVANGQTGDKVSLQRFVLSVLLDDVLLEASQRLSMMSKGRYQLLRKEDRSKGNKASGLDLEVEDAYTGKVRPVATLSGGESFMAALAMALGLSDVVQAYAGGIRLDTLFIDEGFGSLDPESLDLGVRTLIDLQASGRMVGVISHVPDLKEQMSQRLDVIAGREGSSIRLVAG